VFINGRAEKVEGKFGRLSGDVFNFDTMNIGVKDSCQLVSNFCQAKAVRAALVKIVQSLRMTLLRGC
jgi:hypothetical protein